MSFKTKIVVFTSLFVLIIFVDVWAIFNHRTDLYCILRPLKCLFLLVPYILIANKVKRFYVLSLISVVIANFFYFYDTTCFVAAMLFYTLNHLLLGLEISKFRNSVKFNMLVTYFSTFCIALIVIYFFVVKNQEGHSVSVLVFGVSLCMVLAIAMVNYLRNMTSPNLYLLLGLLSGLLANVVVSLNVFNLTSDNTLMFLTVFLFAIAHYFIWYSFIIRENY